jgi:hypothetical protein
MKGYNRAPVLERMFYFVPLAITSHYNPVGWNPPSDSTKDPGFRSAGVSPAIFPVSVFAKTPAGRRRHVTSRAKFDPWYGRQILNPSLRNPR